MAEADPAGAAAILPAPPTSDLPVTRHIVTDAGQAQLLFLFDMQDVEPGATYVAEAWVLIPDEFQGTHVGLTLVGYFAEAHVAADVGLRNRWQRLSVTSRVPHDQSRAVPALIVRAERDAVVFSTGWCVRRDGPLPKRPASSGRRTYKVVGLRDLVGGESLTPESAGRVSRAPCLPDVDVAIPPVSFGQEQRPEGAVTEWPPNNWDLRSYAIRDADIYTLKDAVVHGEQGIVTVGDALVSESLYFAQPGFAGFKRAGDDRFELLAAEPELELDRAAHLLCGYVSNRNYTHWWVDVVPALLVPPFHDAFDGAQLLWPKLRQVWQSQTLELLPEARGRSVFVGEHARVACNELRIVPQITQSDFHPHPFRSRILDAVKERAGWKGEGGRRLYITRRDAQARRLLNEEAAVALLERHGFEAVTLTGLPVREQIRLFASASHVMGAHGAGLGNVLFCEPGSVLCEFQMTSNVQWSIRRLAAVARMRYGCLMGTAADDTVAVNLRDWTIDLRELEAVLDTPAFRPA